MRKIKIESNAEPADGQVATSQRQSNGSPKRIGFLPGKFKVPENFDTFAADEIEAMFYGPKD